jgi:lamin B
MFIVNLQLNESEEHAQRCSAMANEARDELAMIRSRFNELEKSAAEHDHVVDALRKQIKDLESQLRFVREDYAHRLQSADEDINRLNGEINRMINEYQDLMDTKIQLGVELQAYQKLLESEESRYVSLSLGARQLIFHNWKQSSFWRVGEHHP